MNKVILYGNVGNDPEFSTSRSGTSVVKLSVATSDGWGESKKTNWHKCVAFGKRAEVIDKWVRKGDKVVIEGSIDYDSYEKDGVKRYYTSILVDSFEFGQKQDSTRDSTRGSGGEKVYDSEGDVPF